MEKLNEYIAWENIRETLNEALQKEHKGLGGRSPFDYVLMLQNTYSNLSLAFITNTDNKCMAYSIDFIKRAVDYKQEGHTFAQLREAFDIPSATYYD